MKFTNLKKNFLRVSILVLGLTVIGQSSARAASGSAVVVSATLGCFMGTVLGTVATDSMVGGGIGCVAVGGVIGGVTAAAASEAPREADLAPASQDENNVSDE